MSIPYTEGCIYHIYNRGNNKQPIAYDEEDYLEISKKLFGRLLTTGDTILAYCLMPNHFHIMLQAFANNSVPKLMQSFAISYGHYYRKKYNYTGHLFQGSYQSKLVDNTPYFVYLSKYIHANPYKDGIVRDIKQLDRYPWSSYTQYIYPQSLGEKWTIDNKPILNLFESKAMYREYVEDISPLSLHKFLNHNLLFGFVEEELEKKATMLAF